MILFLYHVLVNAMVPSNHPPLSHIYPFYHTHHLFHSLTLIHSTPFIHFLIPSLPHVSKGTLQDKNGQLVVKGGKRQVGKWKNDVLVSK